MKDMIIKQQAMDDLHFWSKNNLKLLKKIFELLKAIQSDPFTGIGKPEALKMSCKVTGAGGLMMSIGSFIKLLLML